MFIIENGAAERLTRGKDVRSGTNLQTYDNIMPEMWIDNSVESLLG